MPYLTSRESFSLLVIRARPALLFDPKRWGRFGLTKIPYFILDIYYFFVYYLLENNLFNLFINIS